MTNFFKVKTMLRIVGIIALAVIIGFSMAACGDGDGGGGDGDGNGGDGGYKPPQQGTLTISNLPTGWVPSYCIISSKGNYQFSKYSGSDNTMYPDDDNWKEFIIGQGNRQDEYDKLEIWAQRYVKMNGSWVHDNTYSGDFNHTGSVSVYLQFDGKPAGVNISQFGVNNVEFTNGNATIDFTAIYNPGSALTNDIDSTLYGTWKDTIIPGNPGSTLTITFSSSGITWGGSAGSALNTATAAYQGSGYTFVWVASNGTISYKFSYQGQVTTIPVYKYRIEGGKLILSTAAMPDTDFATLEKE